MSNDTLAYNYFNDRGRAHVTAYNYRDVVPMVESRHPPTAAYWRAKLAPRPVVTPTVDIPRPGPAEPLASRGN